MEAGRPGRCRQPGASRDPPRRRAADDPALAGFSLTWPFETGFGVDALPDCGPFVLHAEIWPGVLETENGSHEVPDARQVPALVNWARELDRDGRLASEFLAPRTLADDEADQCVTEEGWTLGATNATVRSASPRTSPRSGAALRGRSGTTEDVASHVHALHRAGVINDDERDDLVRRLRPR